MMLMGNAYVPLLPRVHYLRCRPRPPTMRMVSAFGSEEEIKKGYLTLSLYKRGSVWWMDFTVRGIRVHETTSTSSKDLAIKVERQRRRGIESAVNGIPVAQPAKKFSDAASEWMNENEARWSNNYITIQHGSLKHLGSTFKTKLLSEVTAAEIGKYQKKRKKDGVSNRTVNIEVSTLRMILKRNKLWHYMVDDVHMLHEREDIGRALDHKEAALLLKACYESNQPSLYPAVVIYCNTGLRSSELRRAHWWQVNFDRCEFQVGKSKTRGGDDRIIPLNQAATDAFAVCRARWPNAKPTDFIFPSEKLAFDGKGSGKIGVMTSYDVDLSKPIGSWKTARKTAKKRAGVNCRLHDLRHHFLTNLAETKTSDSTILAIAGHLSRKMLERYSHIRSNAKRTAIEAMVQTSLEHS